MQYFRDKTIYQGVSINIVKDNVLSQAKRKCSTMIKIGAGETNDLLEGLTQVKDSKDMGHGKGKGSHVSSFLVFYFSKINLDQLF